MMKLMIASDIHGSAYYCEKMIAAFYAEQADRLLLLGDMIYHSYKNENCMTQMIQTYEKYGLPIDCNRDKITNQTFSALLSKNLAEIADQFIEIHPLGYRYIKDNISCLKEYSNPEDIVFYNIYESQTPVRMPNGKYRITNAFKEIKINIT